MNPRRIVLLTLALIGLLAAAGAARADTIHLKDGTVIRGQVVAFEDGMFVIALEPTDSHRGHQDRLRVTAHTVDRIDFDRETAAGRAPDYGSGYGSGAGVTLYKDENFHGTKEVFSQSDPNLSDNVIGNDTATSVRVPPGWRVTLYEDSNYRGRSVTLTNDESNLGRTTLGNDVVSSLRVEPTGGEGVTLYRDKNFRGVREVFTESDPNLRDNAIGNDTVTSIRVPPGYEVTLYTDKNYHGRSLTLRRDEADLRRTSLGNDMVSSLRVVWLGHDRR